MESTLTLQAYNHLIVKKINEKKSAKVKVTGGVNPVFGEKITNFAKKSVGGCGEISMTLIDSIFKTSKDQLMLSMHVSMFCCDIAL